MELVWCVRRYRGFEGNSGLWVRDCMFICWGWGVSLTTKWYPLGITSSDIANEKDEGECLAPWNWDFSAEGDKPERKSWSSSLGLGRKAITLPCKKNTSCEISSMYSQPVGWKFQRRLLKRQRKMTVNNWKELALNRSWMTWLRKPKPKKGCKANWKEKTKKKKGGGGGE